MNKKIIIFAVFFFINALLINALELPKTGKFKIKSIKDLKVLYVHHKEKDKHISNSIVQLVQYYLLNDDKNFKVIFPQLSIESSTIKGTYCAIEYKGKPVETPVVKIATLKKGLFASYIYQGNYKYIGKGIKKTIQNILRTGKYIPHEKNEIRLLYWNSIDDNYPSKLITEIQVRVKKIK